MYLLLVLLDQLLFLLATRKNYQDYFEKLKEEREANYKQKLILCEKVENILTEDTPDSGKEWIELSEQVLEIQKVWKTIGMVPAAVNNEVFERFRMACNKFFEGKNDFWKDCWKTCNVYVW